MFDSVVGMDFLFITIYVVTILAKSDGHHSLTHRNTIKSAKP